MKSSTLLTLLFITVVCMGMVHYVALELSLYWQYRWFDIPMHILGGVIAAFVFITVFHFVRTIPERYFSLFSVLAFVLFVGLLWELFEIWAGISLLEEDFGRDVVKDLVMDLVGGTIGYIVGRSMHVLDHV